MRFFVFGLKYPVYVLCDIIDGLLSAIRYNFINSRKLHGNRHLHIILKFYYSPQFILFMSENKELFAHLTFSGAAGEVTGANFLLEIDGKKILVDCGMHQGTLPEEDKNWKTFSYDPKSIDALFVTHAHEDHIGLIPKLVHDGFRGVIYSTAPTRDIAELMFQDSIGFLTTDAKSREVPMIYSQADIAETVKLWKVIPYHDKVVVTPDLFVTLYDAGHVLGSSMYEFSLTKNGVTKKMLFTGDLGNTPTTLLNDTDTYETPNFLLMESVYGDRNHEPEDRKEHLVRVIDGVIKDHGTLMIPSFSLERTQEVLFDLDQLIETGRVPKIAVYMDSPLASKITEVYRKYTDDLNKSARSIVKSGHDIFNFETLTIAESRDESIAINHAPDPKIIIAGSGMMNGGRIIHHAEQHLADPKATLLLVGYQAVGTLGRLIQSGERTVAHP